MTDRMKPLLAAFALLLVSLATSGCSSTEIIDPVIDIEGRKLLVHPFRDEVFPAYRSRPGNMVAQAVSNDLMAHRREDGDDVIDLVPFERLQAEVNRITDRDPFDIEPRAMAKRLDADLVLIGHVTRFQTSRPGDVGVLRGRADCQIRVLDVVDASAPPLLDRRLTVRFPPDDIAGTGFLAGHEMEEVDLEYELVRLLGREISKLLRYHEERKKGRFG